MRAPTGVSMLTRPVRAACKYAGAPLGVSWCGVRAPRNVTAPVTSSRHSPSSAAQHHVLPLNMATAHVTPSLAANHVALEQPQLFLHATSPAAPLRP